VRSPRKRCASSRNDRGWPQVAWLEDLGLAARIPAGPISPRKRTPTTCGRGDRIPTILRSHTGGAKSIEGSGSTLDELFADINGRYDGLRERLIDEKGLRRFINVYLNDEDVRFLGGLSAPVSDGDTVTVLPAVAGGAY
jgi:molybdopterin synthase sulfur carrier subunit